MAGGGRREKRYRILLRAYVKIGKCEACFDLIGFTLQSETTQAHLVAGVSGG